MTKVKELRANADQQFRLIAVERQKLLDMDTQIDQLPKNAEAQIEKLRSQADAQCELIKAQEQRSLDADEELSRYIRARAEVVLIEGMKKYGELFRSEMEYVSRRGYKLPE